MLRITVETTDQGSAIKLEGKLAGAWVGEVEKAWHTVASGDSHPHVVVDLCGVSFIGPEGKNLLRRMRDKGAEFRCCGPDISATVEEIVATPNR
jgi:anti-anti-sigma regulatory factor